MTDEKVLVRIQWTERVHYESEVTMTKANYQRFATLWEESDEDDNDKERALANVDREGDWVDSDDIEIDQFDIVTETSDANG